MNILEDICRVRVRFSEADSMRRVWHGNYVVYLEDGRESFGKRFPGIDYATMQQARIYAPVYNLHVRYLSPLAANDIAVVHTRYVYHPGARLDFAYKIYKENGNILCAEAETTQLFIDSAGELLTDLPEYFIRWQKKFLSPENE